MPHQLTDRLHREETLQPATRSQSVSDSHNHQAFGQAHHLQFDVALDAMALPNATLAHLGTAVLSRLLCKTISARTNYSVSVDIAP